MRHALPPVPDQDGRGSPEQNARGHLSGHPLGLSRTVAEGTRAYPKESQVLDEEAPGTPDTPVDEAAPEEGHAATEMVEAERYKNAQAELTRKSQILSDREKWRAHGEEHFPDMFVAAEPEPEPEPESYDDEYEDQPEYMTRAEYDKREAEREAARVAEVAQQEFARDLKKFVGDRELDEYGNAWINTQTFNGPEELEQAVNAYFDHLDSIGAKPRRKRPTTSPAGGKAVTGVPNYGDMTHEQATEAMVERARALESQT